MQLFLDAPWVLNRGGGRMVYAGATRSDLSPAELASCSATRGAGQRSRSLLVCCTTKMLLCRKRGYDILHLSAESRRPRHTLCSEPVTTELRAATVNRRPTGMEESRCPSPPTTRICGWSGSNSDMYRERPYTNPHEATGATRDTT